MVRADKTGVVIADILINKLLGERGVTLVGFGLGARCIYACLMSLAERRAFGLVEAVVLMGTPAPSDARNWAAMRSAVAGRLVNVYSENDHLLAFLNRSASTQYGSSGLQAVRGAGDTENFDASNIIGSHLDYPFKIGDILSAIGWEDVVAEQIAVAHEVQAVVTDRVAKETAKELAWAGPRPNFSREASRLGREAASKAQHNAGVVRAVRAGATQHRS
jgi:hypothetical protein